MGYKIVYWSKLTNFQLYNLFKPLDCSSQILAFIKVDLSLQPSLIHHHEQCLNQQTNYQMY